MSVEQSQLGKATRYDSQYDPQLLFPIARHENRSGIGITNALPFQGEDLWTCYELSWLETGGKPAVAVAEFRVPASSPNIIESKSFKLYLNSLNQREFVSRDALKLTLEGDLSKVAGAEVNVRLYGLDEQQLDEMRPDNCWRSLDEIDATGFVYQPEAGLLTLNGIEEVEERLYSNLLRSNCPVTGQPDWGSVFVHYSGRAICHQSLLRYIVSFRQCQDFHEHCVERMFQDLMAKCGCESLSVYARYTRRGGLDINPYRASPGLPLEAPALRLIRQ